MTPEHTTEDGAIAIRRALVSVYDKTGIEELATALHGAGVQIVSTGSTAARIAAAGVPVVEVSEVTGFPECLDGRVKTLHPKVHAGILADLRLDDHHSQLEALGMEPFQLVVVNLYPFTDTVASGAGPDECIEQIDIGGPSMVRGAAKNHASVAVVTSPAAYGEVIEAVRGEGFTLAQRAALAAQAFIHTANYDIAVASWLGNVVSPTDGGSGFPGWVGAAWERAAVLRYGENPHQRAALYVSAHFAAAGWPGPSSCTARRCRTTTTSTPTPRTGPPTTSTSRRWRSSSTPTRAASRSVPTSPRPTPGPMRPTPSRRSAA